MTTSCELDIDLYDRDPEHAITDYWLACAEAGVELPPVDVANVVVDAHCARGDYDGCSTELELDHCDALARAEAVIGGGTW